MVKACVRGNSSTYVQLTSWPVMAENREFTTEMQKRVKTLSVKPRRFHIFSLRHHCSAKLELFFISFLKLFSRSFWESSLRADSITINVL